MTRVFPPILLIVAVAAIDLGACRTPTDMTVHVVTDVPCEKQRGVTLAAGAPSEYETLPPAARAQECTPLGDGRYDVGRVVLVPHADEDDRVGIKIVLGVDHDAESCTLVDGYKGCVVARRLIHYIPHIELSVDVPLADECKDVPCDALTTCVNSSCVGATVPPEKCGAGCGPGDLPGVTACGKPGSVSCVGGRRITCEHDGTTKQEDCGVFCAPDRCVAASQVVVAEAASDVGGTACALVGTDVYCWGSASAFGRLGLGATDQALTPTKVAGLPPIRQLAAMVTSGHIVAVGVDGSAWCWGENSAGACGTDRLQHATPIAIVGASGPLKNVALARSGSEHTCLLFEDGHLECLGNDGLGALGRGTAGAPDPTPRPIDTTNVSGKIVDFACATNACCAIDQTHAVVCWGHDESGQVGNGTPTLQVPTPQRIAVGAAHHVSAGDNAFCAALDDGTVDCWGSQAFALFPDAPTLDHPTPTPIVALAARSVNDFAVGAPPGHYATTLDGHVLGWGDGGLVVSPVNEVGALAGATQIAIAWKFGCAVVAGTVLCWNGSTTPETSGALGDGTTTPHTSPSPVVWPPM